MMKSNDATPTTLTIPCCDYLSQEERDELRYQSLLSRVRQLEKWRRSETKWDIFLAVLISGIGSWVMVTLK